MIHIPFFCLFLSIGLTVSSNIWSLDKRLNCSQAGLDHCEIKNCSDKCKDERKEKGYPNFPEWDREDVGIWMKEPGQHYVMNVTWIIKSDATMKVLLGSEINILDESTNQSMCVQFCYELRRQQNPKEERWKFSLNGVVVEPGHTYAVWVFNLPKNGDKKAEKRIVVPGCDDRDIRKSRQCLQNGSLWHPYITDVMSVDKEHKMLTIVVSFKAALYSETYRVSIQSPGFHSSKNVSKANGTLLNVTFNIGLWKLSQCELSLTIQPFFIRCKNDCQRREQVINYCPYYPPRTKFVKAAVGLFVIGTFLAYLLWRYFHEDPVNTFSPAVREQPEAFQVRERKKVFVIYSLDHPLYKHIILKLCAFLVAKCGTEVVLDLLDLKRLGVLGSIQWLDWHRGQIENSSNKILILCSRGVQAKWRAMCGDKQVCLREDSISPVGDMLSPALSLLVPHFIRSTSFEKYIVAYFDDICSEEDVPLPFNITLRYKLMKQFEEVFFRILDTEKHEPGRVNHIKGLSEDDYYKCPSGRALRDAIEAFHAYQLENPQWFEDELLEDSTTEVEEPSAEACSDAETTTNFLRLCSQNSIEVSSHEKTRSQESDVITDNTRPNGCGSSQMSTLAELNPIIFKKLQPV